MSKRKWILRLIIIFVVLVALMVSIRIYTGGGIAGFHPTRFVKAELYVNGEKAEKPAVIWWYNYGSKKPPSPEYKVNLNLPFYATLEALGCQIDRDETLPVSDATIIFGDSRLFFDAETKSLFRDGELLLPNCAMVEQTFRGMKGQLFFFDYREVTYVEALEALGFDLVETEIDRDALIVKIHCE